MTQSVITQVIRNVANDSKLSNLSMASADDSKVSESHAFFSQDPSNETGREAAASQQAASPACSSALVVASVAGGANKVAPVRRRRSGVFKALLCCIGWSGQRRLRRSSFISTAKGPPDGKKFLLTSARKCDQNKKCLIIDLDETLVHSSFQPIPNADYVIPVEIDGITHQVYVLKRPHVDEFLQRIGGLFECVLFTASLGKYAEPVADLLDKKGVFRQRLLREACVLHDGNYVKDLRKLGRDLHKVIILDNSPASYAFHPENALPVQSWYDDANDTELLDIVPILERLATTEDIYPLLKLANSRSFRSITMLCADPDLNDNQGGDGIATSATSDKTKFDSSCRRSTTNNDVTKIFAHPNVPPLAMDALNLTQMTTTTSS